MTRVGIKELVKWSTSYVTPRVFRAMSHAEWTRYLAERQRLTSRPR